jgi:ABC-2 type transport system ATP-binding protein
MFELAETQAVTMRYGAFTAVDSVDLTVRSGEVVGLLGANGAGKTTLIRLLLGLVRPSAGVTLLFGSPPSVSGRRRVGYVPQTLGLYFDMTVRENWDFTVAAFGGGRADMPSNLSDVKDQLVGTLPLGTQRRVAFAVAFSHAPDLLVLDEPTSGVDPLGRARLWEDIRSSAEHGAGVLVTTHNMEEAEQCDRLVVMVEGRVAAEGTVGDVTGHRQVVEVRSADWKGAFEVLDAEGFVIQVHEDVLRVPSGRREVEGLLERRGVRATVTTVPANLEEAFVAVVSAGSRG